MKIFNKLKRKGLSQFTLRFFVFLAIIFVLDFSIGRILKSFYFTQDSGLLFRTTFAMDSTTAQMLIFGSSTANHHYEPHSFENRLNVSLYNAGRDGNNIFYHFAVLQGILIRYSPKIAILDFNKLEFAKNPDSYDRITSLLPYYETNPKIRSIIELKSPYEKYKLLSKIYPFNSILFTVAVGNLDVNKDRKNNNDIDGYIPISKVWKNPLSLDTPVLKYEIDSNKVKYFRSFITECIKSDVNLFIVVSPRFIKYTTEDISIALAHEISDEFNIPFYDFSNDPYFLNHPELFADISHLNQNGAKIYSNKVIDKILDYHP
ncbi:MAG: hypothetical protein ABIP35_13060 [Ginsengibacter sp.]